MPAQILLRHGNEILTINCRTRKIRPLIPHLFQTQNNSNCCVGGVVSTACLQEKISISPNCLSVIRIIPICPWGGKTRFTRWMCTSAFSALGQWRTYIENWNIEKPSLSRFCLNNAYSLRAFGLSVGKSKNTSTHMIRYSLKRSLLTTPDR